MTINEKEPPEPSQNIYYFSKDSRLAKEIDQAKMLASSALDRLIYRGEDMSNLKGTSYHTIIFSFNYIIPKEKQMILAAYQIYSKKIQIKLKKRKVRGVRR